MATRRGRFGRLPAAAPSLANEIIAIARQMQSARDQLIMDAWQNGGTFEGQPATDNAVLAYWADRQNNLDPSDPEYEQIKDNITQLQYGIAQSNMEVLYKQGKVTDAQFARFYLDWAKKVPRDSEFWRTLQKNAGQFMEAAKSAGRAGASAATKSNYETYRDNIVRSDIAVSSVLTDVFTQIARDNNLIGRDEALNKFILKGDNDPANMERLLTLVNQDLAANPARYAALTAQIKSLDPGWDGHLTSAYFAKSLTRAQNGYAQIAQAAAAGGYKSETTWAQKGMADTNELAIEVKAWPAGQAYAQARAPFDAVMNSPIATELDRVAAATQFATALDKIAKDPALDLSMANRLRNDAANLRGDPNAQPQDSFGENFLGLKDTSAGTTSSATGKTSGENATWHEEFARANFYQQAIAVDPASYVYASSKVDANGNLLFDANGNSMFDETGKGRVTIVPRQSVDLSSQATSIIPTITASGKVIMQAVNQDPIFVDGPNGKTQIGSALTYNQLGRSVTIYGVPGTNGGTIWTIVAPWAAGVQETHKPDGIHLAVGLPRVDTLAAAVDAATKAGYVDAASALSSGQFVNGQSWTQNEAWNADGTQKTVDHVTYKDGQLTVTRTVTNYDANANPATLTDPTTGLKLKDPTTGFDVRFGNQIGQVTQPDVPLTPAALDPADFVIDRGRQAAGPDMSKDFADPLFAAMSNGDSQGAGMTGDAVAQLWRDPTFVGQLQQRQMVEAQATGTPIAAIQQRDAGIAANAWDRGTDTMPNYVDAFGGGVDRPSIKAQLRQDLFYPGQKTADRLKPQLVASTQGRAPSAITFGHALTVPTMPSNASWLLGQPTVAPQPFTTAMGAPLASGNTPFAVATPTATTYSPSPAIAPVAPVAQPAALTTFTVPSAPKIPKGVNPATWTAYGPGGPGGSGV